ncbi:MAG: hypothetical protein NVS2B3_05870 [Vulcanimicrobiaceae bacterium]
MKRGSLVAALATAAVAVAAGPAARGQAVIRRARSGGFVPYGLDAVRLRLVRTDVFRFASARGAMPRFASALPRTETGYLFFTLDLRNDGRIAENIPLLQATLHLADGTTIDPAVYGPFVGTSAIEAPSSATIAPHGTLVLHLAIGDVPNDRRVASVVLSPNDATPAYRFPLDVATEAADR